MEWISATHGEPPKDKRVIFYEEDHDFMAIGKWVEGGTYGEPSWFVENEEYKTNQYTHWMLAPDVPKKGNK